MEFEKNTPLIPLIAMVVVSIIALIIVLVVSYLAVTTGAVPEILGNWGGTIIGFFVGLLSGRFLPADRSQSNGSLRRKEE